MTAEADIGVFRVAFEQWIDEEKTRESADLVRSALANLRELIVAR